MNPHTVISEAIKEGAFKQQLGGVKANYTRWERVGEAQLLRAFGSITLTIFPLSLSVEKVETKNEQSKKRYGRFGVIWVAVADLNIAGEPFLPEPGDEISYRVDGEICVFTVEKYVLDGVSDAVIGGTTKIEGGQFP